MVRTARQGPSPVARAATPAVFTLALLCLAAAIAAALPLPFGLGAAVFLVAGHAMALRTMSRAIKARVGFATVLLAGVCLVILWTLTLVTVARAAFYPVQAEYERCQVAAVTEQGASACDEQLQSGLQQYVRRFT